jgi:hypothetical protein
VIGDRIPGAESLHVFGLPDNWAPESGWYAKDKYQTSN